MTGSRRWTGPSAVPGRGGGPGRRHQIAGADRAVGGHRSRGRTWPSAVTRSRGRTGRGGTGRGADRAARRRRSGPDGRRASTGRGPRARCVLAPNPSPMTLDGTNTWVLRRAGRRPGRRRRPGPRRRGAPAPGAAAGRRGAGRPRPADPRPSATTRRARGASPSWPARRCARSTPRTGSATRGWPTATWSSWAASSCGCWRRPGTPDDSLCFRLPADRAVLTGDTVLGRGTTVVAPDGGSATTCDSLDRLRAMAEAVGGHGAAARPRSDARRPGRGARRLPRAPARAPRAGPGRGRGRAPGRPGRSWRSVYADVDRSLWPAAELSVRAQLDYLTRASAPAA